LSASADAPAAQVAASLGGGDTNPVLKTLQQLQVADAACGVHGEFLTLPQAMQEAGVSVDVSAGASCSCAAASNCYSLAAFKQSLLHF